MSNYGQQPPYGQNQPNPYGQQQPGQYPPQQPYGNLSSPIRASRAPTVSSRTHRSSRTVNPASKARTGSNRASGRRSRPLSSSPVWSCVLCRS